MGLKIYFWKRIIIYGKKLRKCHSASTAKAATSSTPLQQKALTAKANGFVKHNNYYGRTASWNVRTFWWHIGLHVLIEFQCRQHLFGRIHINWQYKQGLISIFSYLDSIPKYQEMLELKYCMFQHPNVLYAVTKCILSDDNSF